MKKGQLDISFGMIFSIIIIIAVLATSFYVIQYFTNLSKCTTVGLFYEGLQEEVDSAWRGTTSKALFTGNLPGNVDYVCFGNMTVSSRQQDISRYNELRKIYRLSSSNIFIYPIQKGCSKLNNDEINHAEIKEFFCVKKEDGKLKVSLEKNAFENRVTIKAI